MENAGGPSGGRRLRTRDGLAASWRLLTGLAFAAAGLVWPAEALIVHMNGTGGITDPVAYLTGPEGIEWLARQGVLVAACTGIAVLLLAGAVRRLRHAPAVRRPRVIPRVARLGTGLAGLLLIAGIVVPAEQYRYYFLAHSGRTDPFGYVTGPEGLGWALRDAFLAAACLWSGIALLVRTRRSASDSTEAAVRSGSV